MKMKQARIYNLCQFFWHYFMPNPVQPVTVCLWENGAQEKTRTSTTLRPLAPEASASTNSATWARLTDKRTIAIRLLLSIVFHKIAPKTVAFYIEFQPRPKPCIKFNPEKPKHTPSIKNIAIMPRQIPSITLYLH